MATQPFTIIGGFTTDDAKKRFEAMAKDGGYFIDEWLIPSASEGLRVVTKMSVEGDDYALGFKWDGDDMNKLVARLMSLDWSMRRTRHAVMTGKIKKRVMH
jgi:hypothetical protein